jgi:hypothetical protein
MRTGEQMLNEDRIDEALYDSFPASDPPFWTLGVERGHRAPASSDHDEHSVPYWHVWTDESGVRHQVRCEKL